MKLPPFEPIEALRRIKDKKALKDYFRKVGYVIPDTFEMLFMAQQRDLPSATRDMPEEEAKAYVLRLVAYYLYTFIQRPGSFDQETPKGKRNLEQVEALIDFCDGKEWYQMRAIMRFIKKSANGNNS